MPTLSPAAGIGPEIAAPALFRDQGPRARIETSLGGYLHSYRLK